MSLIVTQNLVRAFAVHVHEQLDERLDALLGLGPSGSAALLHIGTRPTRSIADLAQWLRLSHSATVRVVDRLVEARVVERHPSTSVDNRRTQLGLTRRGRQQYRRALGQCDAAVDELMCGLSATERRHLDDLLRKLMSSVVVDRNHARALCRYCNHVPCHREGCPVGSSVSDSTTVTA